MKKLRRKKLGGKAIARIITVAVFGVSTGVIVLTVLFFARTLRSVDSVRTGGTASASLVGINGTNLDAMLKFDKDRRSRPPLSLEGITDPFQPMPKREEQAAETVPAAPEVAAPPTGASTTPPATPAQ